MTEFGRIVRFVLLEASAGLIEFGSFTLLNEFTEMRYWPCYLIALVLSVIYSFTVNRKFTFRTTANVPRAMTLIILYYSVFTPLSSWGGDYLAETLGWNEYLVTILNLFANLITEWLFYTLVVYRGTVDSAVKTKEV